MKRETLQTILNQNPGKEMNVYVGLKKYNIGSETSPTTMTLEDEYIVMETNKSYNIVDQDGDIVLDSNGEPMKKVTRDVVTYIDYENITRVKVFLVK